MAAPAVGLATVTCVTLAHARSSAEVSLPEVVWQTNYERKGENYWWDLPSHVCRILERSYAADSNEGIAWMYCWNPQDDPAARVTSKYIFEPLAMTQRNSDTGICRQVRRMIPAPVHTAPVFTTSGGDSPGPESDGNSDADMSPAPACEDVNPDTFVLSKGTSSRPQCGVHVRCNICERVMKGGDLTAHEALAHARNDFGCHQCTKTFYSSRAVRKHSQDTGHAISIRYRYTTYDYSTD